MDEWVQKLTEKLKQSKWAPRAVLVLGVGGMLLILLSEMLPTKKSTTKPAASGQSEMLCYETQLEKRLETLVSQIDGAGKTSVMVTLESNEINVYALDTQQGEADARQTHVLLDDGSALTETLQAPEIRGVAVVCEGGDQLHVETQITDMLASLLDLSTNRISVAKMN